MSRPGKRPVKVCTALSLKMSLLEISKRRDNTVDFLPMKPNPETVPEAAE